MLVPPAPTEDSYRRRRRQCQCHRASRAAVLGRSGVRVRVRLVARPGRTVTGVDTLTCASRQLELTLSLFPFALSTLTLARVVPLTSRTGIIPAHAASLHGVQITSDATKVSVTF